MYNILESSRRRRRWRAERKYLAPYNHLIPPPTPFCSTPPPPPPPPPTCRQRRSSVMYKIRANSSCVLLGGYKMYKQMHTHQLLLSAAQINGTTIYRHHPSVRPSIVSQCCAVSFRRISESSTKPSRVLRAVPYVYNRQSAAIMQYHRPRRLFT